MADRVAGIVGAGVRNAPSPAATPCMVIAEHVVEVINGEQAK